MYLLLLGVSFKTIWVYNLRKASLQHEHLKESHEIPLRSHVTTQIEENKLSIQNEVGSFYGCKCTSKITVFEESKRSISILLLIEGW